MKVIDVIHSVSRQGKEAIKTSISTVFVVVSEFPTEAGTRVCVKARVPILGRPPKQTLGRSSITAKKNSS
jgi:hypothetical protein